MSRVRDIILLSAVMFGAGRAYAQVPARPPADTARVGQDTSRAAPTFADSVRSIARFPQHYTGPANGFSDGVWAWDHAAFLAEAAVTVGDLLERIPGVLVLRSGLYLQPEAAASLGGTANRLEVWLDGYALDPLLESSFDLAKLELAEVDSVRVERRLGSIRVHVYTLAARDSRAYSRVEAGVGQPNANLFRGIFLSPKLFFGPIGLAIDRIDTNGLGGKEPADQSAGWLKWSHNRSNSGLQVEYRRATTDRNGTVPWAQSYVRDDVILRARGQFGAGLTAELFGGRSTAQLDTTTSATNKDSVPRISEKNTQFGGAVSYVSPSLWAHASVRLRDALALAATQFDASAGIRYNMFSATVAVQQSDWRDAGSALAWSLRGEATPIRGVQVFGETSSSDRGIPYLNGLPDSSALITSYSGYRVGAQVVTRGITLGGALLHAKTDLGVPFGLPFDRAGLPYFGALSTGWEVSGRVPIPLLKGLYAQGMITDWQSGNVSLYMPNRMFRTGLEYHALPMKSGSLELLGRIELVHRGAMLAPDVGVTSPSADPVALPEISYIDAYLQIRIIDVRAFLRYEDLQGQEIAEVTNRLLRGPRLFYGVKWEFFN